MIRMRWSTCTRNQRFFPIRSRSHCTPHQNQRRKEGPHGGNEHFVEQHLSPPTNNNKEGRKDVSLCVVVVVAVDTRKSQFVDLSSLD
mmetsp:Transcript_23181/g.35763  ORF Transcript_23181/g.35763 Transcript_23181/m.35763 type:complete len:87 (-) Transcript_23181:8-268(-)